MHLPPAAQIHIGRSRAQLQFLACWAVVYACFLVFLSDSMAPMALAALALTCLVISTYAVWRWWHSPVGVLAWTGQQWVWQEAQVKHPCSLRWGADFQSIVLLGIHTGDRRRHWLWAEHGTLSEASWRAFRRALLASDHALDPQVDDEIDFESSRLISSQQPHIQPIPAGQGAVHRLPGIQNSTQR